MTQRQPKTQQPAPAVHRIIREAIADPAKFKAQNFLEEEPSWQATAVTVALAVHGYDIVPSAEPGHPEAGSS